MQNFLQLSDSKAARCEKHFRFFDDLTLSMKPVDRNVGEVFDSDLTFEEQVERVVLSCFLQLRNL